MKPATTRVRNRTAGFSLLEFVAALFVFTIVGFGAVQMFYVGIRTTQTANEAAIAVRAIDNQIELLRATPFQQLPEPGEHAFAANTPELELLVNAHATIRVADDPTLPMKQVTARVSWTTENGRAAHRELVTLIANANRP